MAERWEGEIMQTLGVIAGCVVCAFGIFTVFGGLIYLSERGKKGKNGVIDLDEYRRGQE